MKKLIKLLFVFSFVLGLNALFSEEKQILEDSKLSIKTQEELQKLKREDFHAEIVKLMKASFKEGVLQRDELGRYYTNGRYKFKLLEDKKETEKLFSHIEYSINGNSTQAYTYPISLSEEGRYRLDYKGFDKLGNVEEQKSYDITVDRTPPEVYYTLEGPSFMGETRLYYKPGVKLFVKATDKVSGVYEILVNIEDKERKKGEQKYKGQGNLPYRDSQKEFFEHGKYTLYIRAFDKVINLSKKKEVEFFVDAKGPSILEARSNPVTREFNGKNYCLNNTEVLLRAEDNETGIFKIEYSLTANGGWKRYPGKIRVSGNSGEYKIFYRAIDNLGNISEVKTFSCELDQVPPGSKAYIKN